MYKVYARVNENNVVTKLYIDLFEKPAQWDICIEEVQGEYNFARHCNTILQDQDGHYNYKAEEGKLVERTDEEKAHDERQKTEIEIIQETLDAVVLSMLGGDGNV